VVVLLALFSSVAFACSNVSALRGTLQGNPRQGVRLTILLGVPFFIVLAAAFGQLMRFHELPALGWALFAVAGVIHFVGGRTFGYLATREVGASRATVITTLSPVVSIVVAVILFGDTITTAIAVGAALVLLGPILMSQGDRQGKVRPDAPRVQVEITPDRLRRGVLFGALAAICWGISPILIKAGLTQASLPVLGTLISYVAAGLVMAAGFVTLDVRRDFFGMSGAAARWYVLAGLFVATAQCLRYLALAQGSVTIVVLLMQAVPIFVIALSFLINRRVESLNRYVVAGGALVTVGAIIIAGR
jgi:drug/metabolite transporter (DMT)-like permease